MKKKVVQDVLPPKKSIRNIELSSIGRESQKESKKDPTEGDVFARSISINKEAPIRIEPRTEPVNTQRPIPPIPPPPPPPTNPTYKYEFAEPKKRSKKWRYLFITVLVLVGAFGISALFRSATIKVTPKQESPALSEVFTAKKDATGNSLGFQVVTVTKDSEKTLGAGVPTTLQKVDKKARGKIVIYNNFGPEAQKLVATTRFETPEGLIFRLIEPITVPGKTTKDGKAVAGSIEVTVEADKVGTSYNIGLKDFTIPGFKGDPKYTEVYARSKTDMTGGFSGSQKVVSKTTLDAENVALENQLKESLSKDIVSQIPSEFILFEESLSYKFEPTTQTNNSGGEVVAQKKGSVNAIIFDKGSLTRAIVAKVLPNAGDEILKITNLESLIFSFETPSSGVNGGTSVTFSLKGTPQFVWVFDDNKLKTDLLGLSKANANKVLSTYGAIKEAWVETRPFWSTSIPKNPEKVTLVNTLNQ